MLILKVFLQNDDVEFYQENFDDKIFKFHLDSVLETKEYNFSFGNGNIASKEDKNKVLDLFELISNKKIKNIMVLLDDDSNCICDLNSLNFFVTDCRFSNFYNIEDQAFPGRKFDQVKIEFTLQRLKEE